MPWAVRECANNRGAVEQAISEFESSQAPTSIDQISTWEIGNNRIGITIVYTA